MASRLLYLVVWLTILRLCVRSKAYEFSGHLTDKEKSDFLREGFDSYILSNTLHFVYDDRFQRSFYGFENATTELKCYVSAPKRSPLNWNNVYHDFTLRWLKYKSSYDTNDINKNYIEVFKQTAKETRKLSNLPVEGSPRRLIKEGNQSNIYEFILRVPLEGSAYYRCLVEDEFGKIFSSSMTLLKAVLPELLDDYVNLTQPTGSNARIQCNLKDKVISKVSIKWLKNGKELKVDGNRLVSLPVTLRGETDRNAEYVIRLKVYGTLHIYNLNKEDEGEYTCIVENPWGSDSKEIASIILNDNSPNNLISKPSDLLLYEETLLGVFECFTSFKSKITWTFTDKNGKTRPIPNSFIYGKNSIVIPKSDLKNVGNYTCHIQSSQVEKYFKAKLALRHVDSVIYTPPIKRVHGMKGLKCTMPFVTGCVYNAYNDKEFMAVSWYVNGTNIEQVAEEYRKKYNMEVFAEISGNREELLRVIREYKGGKTKLNVTMRHEILNKSVAFVESLPSYVRFSVLKISAEFTALSGYYQCLVSNYFNEYSQSSQFHIPETSPDVDNITVVKTMPTAILLNITRKKLGGFRSQDEVIVVNIQFTCNSTGPKPDWYSNEDWQACLKDGEEVFDMKPTSRKPNWRIANVTKLLPDTNYSVQIVPYSKRGCGSRTPVHIKTKAIEPTAYPNYRLAISSTSVKFQFDRLLGPKCGGRITHYIVRLGNIKKSIENGIFEGEITGLAPDTEYKFLIVPNNEAGEAKFSEANFKTIRTLKNTDLNENLGFPSMKIESMNVTSAKLHLGNNHSYVDIYLKYLSSKSGIHYPDENKNFLNITTTVFKVSDLVLDSKYELDVVYYGRNSAIKKEIYFFSTSTNNQPPPMPVNLEASIVRKSSKMCCIQISWEESKSWIGTVQQYVIKYSLMLKNYREYGTPIQKHHLILQNYTVFVYEIHQSCQSCQTIKSEKIIFQVQAEIDSRRKSKFSSERTIHFNSSTIIGILPETTSVPIYNRNDQKKFFWIGISGVTIFLLTVLLFICIKHVKKMMYLRKNRNTERATAPRSNVGTPVNMQIQERQPLFIDALQTAVINGEICSETHGEEVNRRRPDLDGFIDTKGMGDITAEFRGRKQQISCSGSVRSGQSAATHSDSGCHESNLTLHSSEKNEDNEGSDTLGHTSSQSSSAETLCNMHAQQHCKCKQIETSCDNYIQRSEIYHPPRPPQQLAC